MEVSEGTSAKGESRLMLKCVNVSRGQRVMKYTSIDRTVKRQVKGMGTKEQRAR